MKKIGIVFPTFNRKDLVYNVLIHIKEQKIRLKRNLYERWGVLYYIFNNY